MSLLPWYAFSPRNRPQLSAGTPKAKSGCLPLGGTVGWGCPGLSPGPRPTSGASRGGDRVGGASRGGRPPGGRDLARGGPSGRGFVRGGATKGVASCRGGASHPTKHPRLRPERGWQVALRRFPGRAGAPGRCPAAHGRTDSLTPLTPAPAESLAGCLRPRPSPRPRRPCLPPPGSQPTCFTLFRALRVWGLQGLDSDPSSTPGQGQRSPQHIPAWSGHLIWQL